MLVWWGIYRKDVRWSVSDITELSDFGHMVWPFGTRIGGMRTVLQLQILIYGDFHLSQEPTSIYNATGFTKRWAAVGP